MGYLATLVLFLLSLLSNSASAATKTEWKYIQTRLSQAGLQRSFIDSLRQNYDPSGYDEVVELNVLLYLRKADYHGVQVTPEAATEVREFIDAQKEALQLAEKEYGVFGPVIASLLWLESRHGKNEGKFHVPSVYIDLLLCDRPETLKQLYKSAHRFKDSISKKDKKEIAERAGKKVRFAIGELQALQRMHRKNKSFVKTLRGSFSGAFGMAQFVPSSYVQYARAANKNQVADLYTARDAIQSVGYYLRANGWRKDKRKTYARALFRYNNSHDYAAAILNLAEQSQRAPANGAH